VLADNPRAEPRVIEPESYQLPGMQPSFDLRTADWRLPIRFTAFELGATLCFEADVIGALQEGETGMRCGPIRPIPQLPPQL
jgi:hypothetical protein